MYRSQMIPTSLQRKMENKNIPLAFRLILTWRCNLRCKHCYFALPTDPRKKTASIKKTIDNLAKQGCLFFVFTGGEPLLRKDFFVLARYAHNKNFAMALETNATLITPAVADKIAKLNFAQVRITLLGSSAGVHDAITCVKGSFEKTLRAARLLRERGVNTFFITVRMKQNKNDLSSMRRLAYDSGVELFDFPVRPKKEYRESFYQ